MTVRECALAMWDQIRWGQSMTLRSDLLHSSRPHRVSLDTVRSYLMYAVEHPGRRKKTPVDIPDLVRRWVPIIRGLSRAHDKATIDRCEFEMDAHLLPLLTAPVAQIRDFYAALVDALQKDDTIPFFVWAAFKAWGEVILKHAPNEAVKELKTDLARQIAELVEKDVQPDLPAAIVGALQWRSAESLEQVHDALKAGAKPRLRGRESCLFLEVVPVGADEPLASVML